MCNTEAVLSDSIQIQCEPMIMAVIGTIVKRGRPIFLQVRSVGMEQMVCWVRRASVDLLVSRVGMDMTESQVLKVFMVGKESQVCPELLVRKEQLAFQVIVMFENYTNSIQESRMVKMVKG